MSFLSKKRNKIIFISLASVLALILICLIVFFIYVGIYYKADVNSINSYKVSGEMEFSEYTLEDSLVYEPKEYKNGFVFYPGGKVEYSSYAPLMRELASQGILCITIKMPFNLAVFNINGADEVRDKFSKVESWYIGGHSLGGSMACSYLEENHTRYKGLILLASYSTSDLSKTNLKVLSVFGTNDKILNMEKYNENLKNIDTSLAEIKIEGGNHAQFGMYGRQDGDGEAIISNEKQIRDTAEAIFDFMK